MALSSNKLKHKKRNNCKHARVKKNKNVPDHPKPDVINGTTNKWRKSSSTVQDKNNCNIGSIETISTKNKTEVSQIGSYELDDHRKLIATPCYNGETSNSVITMSIDDKSRSSIACKPCSVVLERLCGNKFENLLLTKNVDSGIKKRTRVKKKIVDNTNHSPVKRIYRRKRRNIRNSMTSNDKFDKECEEDEKRHVENSNENYVCGANNDGEAIDQFQTPLRYGELKRKNSSERVSNRIPSTKISNENASIIGAIFQNSEHKLSPSRRFRLSLRKNINNSQENQRQIPPTENKNNDQKIDGQKPVSSRSPSICKELSLKRSLSDTENNDEVTPKRKRYTATIKASINDLEKLNASNSSAVNFSLGQQFNRPAVIDGSEILNDQNFNEKLNLDVKCDTPITKDLTISLIKLSNSPDSPENESKANVVKSLNTCARVRIYQRKIMSCTPPKADVNDVNKFRNKKITDYFKMISKKSVALENNTRTLNPVENYLTLKKEYGVCKRAIVSLVDLKTLKISNLSEYVASEMKKLTNQDTKSFPTLNIFATPESTSGLSTSLWSNNLPQDDNVSSTTEVRSFAGISGSALVNPDAEAKNWELTHACKSPRIEKCSPISSPIKCKEDSSIEGSATEGVLLKSGNRMGSPNRKDRVKDCSFVTKNSYRNGNDLRRKLTRNSRTKYLSESNPTLNPLLMDDDEFCYRGINDTPETLKGKNSFKRSLSLSPRKCRGSIISNIETSESQLCWTQINTVSDKVPKKQNFEEVGRKKRDTSLVDKDSEISPVHVSPLKSPPNKGEMEPEIKQESCRRLPLNTMTCLSFGALDDDSSSLGLDSTTDDVSETGRTENEQIVTQVDNNTKVPCTRATKKKVDENLLPNTHGLKTTGHSAKLKNTISESEELLETLDKPVHPKVEPCANKGNASMVESRVIEKKADDEQRSAATSGNKRSKSTVLVLEKVSSTENYDKPIPVFYSDKGPGKANSIENPFTDPVQQGELVVDLSDMDVDTATEEEDVIPDRSSTDSSAAGATVRANEASENSEMISIKECVMCKKKFVRIVDLEKHLKVHIKDPNSCILCDKTLTKDNVVKHYLEHCGYVDENELDFHSCDICNRKFRKLSGIKHHLKSKHKLDQKRFETWSAKTESNKCTICLATFNSKYDLATHVYSHTDQELQDAYKLAKANQQLQPVTTPAREKSEVEASAKAEVQAPRCEPSDTSKAKISKNPGEAPAKSTTTSETTETSSVSAPSDRAAVSICVCHKDERLKISGSVIIEVALTCKQCKTFFKTRRCFKDHFLNQSCEWSEITVAIPAMFCNKCCVILSSLQEMHSHLKQHVKSTLKTKSSFLCKLCNVYFFGIGSLFYEHWFNHCKTPLFIADHSSFPNNFKVKIVEPEPAAPPNKDESTENLFVAEHQCHNCQVPFETDEDLRKHLNSSNSCSKKFESRHKVTENPKLKIICSICNKEFEGKPGFDEHVKDHDDIRNLLEMPKSLIRSSKIDQRNCNICKTEYKTAKLYKEHLIRHDILREKFACNYCSLIVDSVEKFEQHSGEHKGTPEKPVACKVIFAMCAFHCKSCKICFDNQTTLEEHLAVHNEQASPNQKSAANSPLKSAPAATKKNNLQNQERNDQVDPINYAHAKKNDASNISKKKEPTVFQISDDSNLSDVEEIAPDKPAEQRKESTVRNSFTVKNKEETPQSTKKNTPAFLRVKNLKELLPYSCSTCKMEFDTQTNFSNHVCNKHDNQAQDPNFKHTCTICNNFKCNSDADWNLHKLSHVPLSSSPRFSNSWFNVLSIQSDEPILKCNICAKYGCVSVSMMRDHFINVHPDVYRPVFNCRICLTFKTTVEQEIRRHEAAHFKRPSGYSPPLVAAAKNSTPLQSVNNPENFKSAVTKPPASKTPYNQPLVPPAARNSPSNSQHSNSIHSIVDFTNNVPQFQRAIPVSSASSLGNNLPMLQHVSSSLQPVKSLNNIQQPVSAALPTNSVNNSLPITSVNNTNNLQETVLIPVTTNSNNNLSSNQPNSAQWIASTVPSFQNQIPTNNHPSFNNVSNLIGTVSSLAVTNPVYCCSICKNFQASSEKQLKAHEALHEFIQLDKPIQSLYRCKDCPNFSCNTPEQLNAHSVALHNSNTAMNVSYNQMQSHPSQISGILKCNNCPQTFVSANDLAQHIYKSHTYFIVNRQPNEIQHDGLYPYGCQLCSIRFSNETYLHLHLRDAHPNGKVTSQKTTDVQNIFRCDVCQLYLVSQAALNCHMRTHNLIF